MNKKRKITVKHYLNTNLKPKKENGKDTYPVYVQIIHKSTNFKIKSENGFINYLSIEELEEEKFVNFLKDELIRIENCVKLISENNPKLLTSKDIHRLSKPLGDLINSNFGKLINVEIKNVPQSLSSLCYLEIVELLNFLNASIDEKSEIISSIMSSIQLLGYTEFVASTKDYIVADLYFGKKYLKIKEAFKQNKNSAKALKNLQYLSEL